MAREGTSNLRATFERLASEQASLHPKGPREQSDIHSGYAGGSTAPGLLREPSYGSSNETTPEFTLGASPAFMPPINRAGFYPVPDDVHQALPRGIQEDHKFVILQGNTRISCTLPAGTGKNGEKLFV